MLIKIIKFYQDHLLKIFLFETFLDENIQNIDNVREGESWEKIILSF